MMKRLRRAAATFFAQPDTNASAAVPSAPAPALPEEARQALADRVAYLESVVTYLNFQVSYQASLLRYLAAPVIHDFPSVRETKESFDFQWAELPAGRFMLENADFRKEAPGYVCEFTGLPAEWFAGKSVIDAGCGLGRYSWALCTLGARVLSLDQSPHGLARTREACREFPGHRAMQVDLLQPLPSSIEPVDLVWSFGVLHHTGDTYRAFRNVAPLVKPGGYLFVMIYGEPRDGIATDFDAVNEYDEWRRRTRNLPLRGKLAAIREGMARGEFHVVGDEHVHGYFDAIAPPINDLYTFGEIERWFHEAGFEEVRQTVATRNLHMIARRSAS